MPTSSVETQKSTEGMVDYAKNSAMQQSVVAHHRERIAGLVARLGEVTPEMRIVDYGCGPGPSAIGAVAPAVAAYRARFPEAPLAVCHADQPGNDWNSLFALANGPDGYRKADPALRMEAAVGSFYEPLAAAGSVALCTCFAASHWLSQAVQLQAPGTIWFADLTGRARANLAAQARKDWVRFLQCRAEELRPGGFLFVSTLGSVPDESEINGIAASGRGIYRAIQTVAQAMADEGQLDPAVLDGFVFGLWFLTAEEAREPLEREASLAEAFAIEEISVLPGPLNPTDVYLDRIDDPATYAKLYTGYIRGFGDSSLRRQLFEPSAGDAAGADRLADDFYRRLETLYRDAPGTYAGEIWNLTVVLRRL
ncbi:MAG TPA: hypothetical protein VKN76_18450 [Kiloniellaceae bacterium]|nr:hypothetical protein [Kiloniellaceae bacterium]